MNINVKGLVILGIIIISIIFFSVISIQIHGEKNKYNEWVKFNKTHNCTLQEIDVTNDGSQYTWLCDGVIYKNRFSDKN